LIASGIEWCHILLLDDDTEERQALKKGLENIGFANISEADDPVAALETMRTRAADLLVCEHYIPFVWFLRTSAKRPAAYTSILMLSGQNRPDDIREAIDSGVNRFVAKPVTPGELAGHIRQILEQPEPFVESDGYIGPDRRRQAVRKDRRTQREEESEAPSPDMNLTPEEIAILLER
jgi:DNA-binding NarL/FixJ family response regulator